MITACVAIGLLVAVGVLLDVLLRLSRRDDGCDCDW